jgi:hypothetical protein
LEDGFINALISTMTGPYCSGVQVTMIVDGCHAGHPLDRTSDHRFPAIGRGHVPKLSCCVGWGSSQDFLFVGNHPVTPWQLCQELNFNDFMPMLGEYGGMGLVNNY